MLIIKYSIYTGPNRTLRGRVYFRILRQDEVWSSNSSYSGGSCWSTLLHESVIDGKTIKIISCLFPEVRIMGNGDITLFGRGSCEQDSERILHTPGETFNYIMRAVQEYNEKCMEEGQRYSSYIERCCEGVRGTVYHARDWGLEEEETNRYRVGYGYEEYIDDSLRDEPGTWTLKYSTSRGFGKPYECPYCEKLGKICPRCLQKEVDDIRSM